MKLKIDPLVNEKEVLRAVSAGDHQSFEFLFLSYYKPLGNYIYQLLEDESQTEDMIQEIFLGLWTDRDRLATVKSFKDYLFIISRNRVYNQLKIKAKNNLMFASIELNKERLEEIEQEQLDDHLTRESYFLLLEHEIEKLPLQQQKIFKLSKINKMKYEQIAQKLNISVETVRKHMYLAQRKLREQLRGKEGEMLLVILSTFYFTKF